MTLVRPVAAISALVLAVTLPGAATAQRSDAFTWKLGLDGGIMAFQTRTQDTKVVPSVGAHILVDGPPRRIAVRCGRRHRIE